MPLRCVQYEKQIWNSPCGTGLTGPAGGLFFERSFLTHNLSRSQGKTARIAGMSLRKCAQQKKQPSHLRRVVCLYSARILSTGLRFALLRTGRNVARKEVNAAIPSMTSHESGPKIKREILIELRPRPFFWNLRCKARCETERYHFRLRGAAGGRLFPCKNVSSGRKNSERPFIFV